VVKASLTSAPAQALIGALNAELLTQYPEDGATHFRLDAAEVAEGRGAFLIAYAGGRPVGCGAIRKIEEGVGEIKRMFVLPTARGQGVGRAVLAAVEDEARRLGLRRLLLETGERQSEALVLYERSGYARIPPFGEYVGSPLSICLGKDL
jgi:GNAT superfamily N-acetyltransferase